MNTANIRKAIPVLACFIFAIAVSIFSACGGNGSLAVATALTTSDNGSTQTIKVGESFTITLDSNVTTGYSWEVSEVNTSILEKTGEEYNENAHPEGMTGGGGSEVFTWKALTAGSTTLNLVYRRASDSDADAQSSFQITVTVTAS